MRISHIRNKLLLASLVVILPFIVWNAITQNARYHDNWRNALAFQQDDARDIADLFATYGDDIMTLSCLLGDELWNEQGVLRPDASAYLSRMCSHVEIESHLSAANPDGVVVASDAPSLVGIDHSGSLAVSRVMHGADCMMSNVFISRLNGRRAFSMTTGARNRSRKLCGMVFVLADEEALRQVLHRGLMGTSHAVITDSQGVVALVSGDTASSWSESDWGETPFVQRALKGKPATVDRLAMPDGHILMGAVVPVPELGWTAGVFTPREDVIGPIRNQAVGRTLLVTLLTVLVVGLAVYLGNRLSRPVLALAGTVRAFGEGKLDTRCDIETGDELEYLGDRFNDMADVLETRDSELRDALDVQGRQSRQVETLYHMAEGVVVTVSLRDKLQVIARALAGITQTKRCIILLRKGNYVVGMTGWGILHQEILESYSLSLSNLDSELAKVLRELQPIVVSDVEQRSWAPKNLPANAALKSVLIIPIAHAGRFVGAGVLDNPGEDSVFSPESIEATRNLAELAAVAIENAQLFEREQHIAEVLQEGLLPSIPREVRSFLFSVGYYPALEFADVGGDFYDYIELPDGRIGIVVADISGKGLEAAVYTAMGKHTMRAFASEDPSPASVLTRANAALTKSNREWGFITMFFAVIDPETGILTYGSAGHPPSVLVRSSGEVSCIPCPDQQPPLGVFDGIVYTERSLRLESGDMLIGYTDGLIEARSNGEMFEIERLCRLAQEHRHEDIEELVDTIYSSVCSFSQGRISDDMAILIVKAR